MATVFLTQETKRNVEKAARFGELRPVLSEGHSFVDDPAGCNEAVVLNFRERFARHTDMILPVGDLVGVFAAGFSIGGVVPIGGCVRVLKWDTRLQDYVAVEITA